MANSPTSFYQPRLHYFALGLACFTPFLLLAGALVTSTGSGMTIPTWPLANGQFFPHLTGGAIIEWTHRWGAVIVGTWTLLLTLFTQRVETRAWVRKLAWTLLAVVLFQAGLGGATVKLELPTWVSSSHASVAEIFFCLVVTLALVTSKSWMEDKPHRLTDRPSPIRTWAAWTTVLVYLQIVVGAVIRHSGAGLAIPDWPLSFGQWLPPEWSGPVFLQFSHTRLGASLVLLFVAHTAYRVCFHFPDEKRLFWPAAAAGFLVWLQVFLGMLIIFTQKAVVPTSVHVIIGAATLASMLVLTLNSFQLFKKESAA